MKVCMIVLNSVWHDPRVRREATSAAAYGIDTTVVGMMEPGYVKEKVDELPFKTVLVELDAKYFRPTRTILTILKREFVRYQKLIDACVALEPDVIHANDLDTLPVAYLAARKTKSRIVYDCHEIFTENESSSRDALRKFFWKTLERFLIRRADQVISVSHSSAAELAAMYGIETPMVVTNCVMPADQNCLRSKPADRFEVLYHGKFYKGRGYEAFIRAAALTKEIGDIHFVLRGLGAIESELRALAAEQECGTRLRFDPPVGVTELVTAASSSHIGVVLTEPLSKNFIHTVSNKLFEYINAGLPVILSDMPEHRYLNDLYDFAVIIDEVTPEKIAEAVRRLHQDHELFERLSANAIRTSKTLNWETEVLKLIDVYKKLTAARRN
jgi:glycosyltransferase involved in cell wall biosynthesis